jgi:hypothetical protein
MPTTFYRPLPGAAWRLSPSHQLIRAVDPPAVTSVSAPNTRAPIFVDRGVGPGARPVLGQVSPEGAAGGQVGLGSSQFLAGFRSAAPAGAGGGGEGAAPAKGKRSSQKLGTDPVWMPLSVEATVICHALALLLRRSLANHRAQVGCVTGRTALPRSLRRCRVGGFGPSAI